MEKKYIFQVVDGALSLVHVGTIDEFKERFEKDRVSLTEHYDKQIEKIKADVENLKNQPEQTDDTAAARAHNARIAANLADLDAKLDELTKARVRVAEQSVADGEYFELTPFKIEK